MVILDILIVEIEESTRIGMFLPLSWEFVEEIGADEVVEVDIMEMAGFREGIEGGVSVKFILKLCTNALVSKNGFICICNQTQ